MAPSAFVQFENVLTFREVVRQPDRLISVVPSNVYPIATVLALNAAIIRRAPNRLGNTNAWNNMPPEERNDIAALLRTATCRGSVNGGPHSPTDLEALGLSIGGVQHVRTASGDLARDPPGRTAMGFVRPGGSQPN